MGDSNGVISDDVHVAERALAEYELPPNSTLRLLNLSENATYAVEDADHRQHGRSCGCTGRTTTCRTRSNPNSTGSTHLRARQRYHRADRAARRGRPPRGDGAVSTEPTGTSCISPWSPARSLTSRPSPSSDFHTLGQITAALHEHSHSWTRPAGFSRFAWDWEHSLGAEGRVGTLAGRRRRRRRRTSASAACRTTPVASACKATDPGRTGSA